jgi:dTDP-4-amino-4,6-dideoxygalactose transaminase
LTCITIDPGEFGGSRHDVMRALDAANIESRPVWKPLHLQPVFASCAYRGGTIAAQLFERGLCLPSGSAMTNADLERVVHIIRGSAARTSIAPGSACKNLDEYAARGSV